jgi:hypothetical protein
VAGISIISAGVIAPVASAEQAGCTHAITLAVGRDPDVTHLRRTRRVVGYRQLPYQGVTGLTRVDYLLPGSRRSR